MNLPLSGSWLDLMILQDFSTLNGSMNNGWIMWTFVLSIDTSTFCSQHNCSTITKEDFHTALNFWEKRSYLPPSNLTVGIHVCSSQKSHLKKFFTTFLEPYQVPHCQSFLTDENLAFLPVSSHNNGLLILIPLAQ